MYTKNNVTKMGILTKIKFYSKKYSSFLFFVQSFLSISNLIGSVILFSICIYFLFSSSFIENISFLFKILNSKLFSNASCKNKIFAYESSRAQCSFSLRFL